MKERVAIATVRGKAYFLIVNGLREQKIPFISLIPGQPVPPWVRLVITTEQEKNLIKHENVLVFSSETEIDDLANEVKRLLLGKEVFERIVFGIDPGESTGLAVLADGKIIEEVNCYSTQEVINNVKKMLRNVNFFRTAASVKIGNGVPDYKELLEALDKALPLEVALEVVSEAGTNKSLKENGHSREIRHISSAIRIAGRNGRIVLRRKAIEPNSRI